MIIRKTHAYAEESAEVEVLSANLEKLAGYSKKLQGSLNRLTASTTSSNKHAKTSRFNPVYGNTQKLQITHRNIDQALEAIEKLRAPLENKDQEESIIRSAPAQVGIGEYVASLERASGSLRGLKATNISANQPAMKEMGALVNYGSRQLEDTFKQQLLSITAPQIEPLQFITRGAMFPTLPEDYISELRYINEYMYKTFKDAMKLAPNPNKELSTMKIYVEIRESYILKSLASMAAATMTTSRRIKDDSLYKRGTCAIEMYCNSMEGLLQAEFENIKAIFTADYWARVILAVSKKARMELSRTILELHKSISLQPLYDCFLAFEILDVMSAMARRLDLLSTDLKNAILDMVQPIYDIAIVSLPQMIEDISTRIQNGQITPDGAPIPNLVPLVVSRLAYMLDYQQPVALVLQDIGESKWFNPSTTTLSLNSNRSNSAQSIRKFDGPVRFDKINISPIYVRYCSDSINTLVKELDQRVRLKATATQHAVFMANHLVQLEVTILATNLDAVLPSILEQVKINKGKQTKAYAKSLEEIVILLRDVIYTNRNSRPTSGGAPDSGSIVKGLNSKERDGIKGKFRDFNTQFEELCRKYDSYRMEPGVRNLFGKDIAQLIQPLYDRFWDRYHEIDTKGKGKHVKWSKAEISTALAKLAM